MIYWHQFSWEAFATLATGLAAVFAALAVGVRQTTINLRQAAILEKQRLDAIERHERDHRLQHQTFRLQVLDRRGHCVDEFRRLWGQWSMAGTLNNEEQNSLYMLLHSAQLIFSIEIERDLKIAVDSIFFETHYEMRFRQFSERGEEAKAQVYLKKSFAANDQVVAVMTSLLNDMIQEARI